MLNRTERDLTRWSVFKPKCEDRRRPPYFERSENAAPIRRSSGRPSILASIQVLLDSVLSYWIPCSAERVVGWAWIVARSEASGKGRPISTRRGEAAPYLPEASDEPLHVSLSMFH